MDHGFLRMNDPACNRYHFTALLRQLTDTHVDKCLSSAATGSHLEITFYGNGSAQISANGHSGVVSTWALLILCAWRVDDGEGVLCGSWDENELDGPKFHTLRRLEGKRIVDVRVDVPTWDLTLRLEGGLRVQVFCDMVNETDLADNYIFYVDLGCWVVGCKSTLAWESRKVRQ